MFWFFVILVIVIAAIFGIAQSNAKAEELKQQGIKNEETFNSLTGLKLQRHLKESKTPTYLVLTRTTRKLLL